VVDNIVYTPGAWASILLGITRDTALTILRDLGYEVRYEPIARDMLYLADEIFFTGTAAEVTPVRSIDRMQIGKGGRGPVTKAVQDAFFGYTSGKQADKYGWLTHVSQPEPSGGG
jgi:branched-chain amino acid aminotransferase